MEMCTQLVRNADYHKFLLYKNPNSKTRSIDRSIKPEPSEHQFCPDCRYLEPETWKQSTKIKKTKDQKKIDRLSQYFPLHDLRIIKYVFDFFHLF